MPQFGQEFLCYKQVLVSPSPSLAWLPIQFIDCRIIWRKCPYSIPVGSNILPRLPLIVQGLIFRHNSPNDDRASMADFCQLICRNRTRFQLCIVDRRNDLETISLMIEYCPVQWLHHCRAVLFCESPLARRRVDETMNRRFLSHAHEPIEISIP